jgi:hypothetical protein
MVRPGPRPERRRAVGERERVGAGGEKDREGDGGQGGEGEWIVLDMLEPTGNYPPLPFPSPSHIY